MTTQRSCCAGHAAGYDLAVDCWAKWEDDGNWRYGWIEELLETECLVRNDADGRVYPVDKVRVHPDPMPNNGGWIAAIDGFEPVNVDTWEAAQ